MKRIQWRSIYLAVLLIGALLLPATAIACGAAAKPKPIPTPTPTPIPAVARPVLGEDFFVVNGVIDFDRGFRTEEVVLVTLDGQKWPVRVGLNTSIERKGFINNRTFEGRISVDLISVERYESSPYKDRELAFAIFGLPPVSLSLYIDWPWAVDRTANNTRVQLRTLCVLCTGQWKKGEFPLADYLFEVDNNTYKREVRHLVLQVLDLVPRVSP